MRRRRLWAVSIATSAEAADAVGEWLGATFGRAVASYTDVETGRTTVTTYFEERPDWSRATQASLRAGLKQVQRLGLEVSPGVIRLVTVRWEDWAESWRRHFRPITFGSALMVKPSWSRRQPRKGQAVIVLDPGLSFGTGHHPTTAFCLRQIVRWRRRGDSQALLDIGTGSGILAIAAAKLGYSPVYAFDIDPEAIRVARANARHNGSASRIRFSRRDLRGLSCRGARKYSFICANLVASVLLTERERILTHLLPGGVLVVAGILREEFADVQAAYEAAGLRLVASQSQREWRSGAFCKGGKLF